MPNKKPKMCRATGSCNRSTLRLSLEDARSGCVVYVRVRRDIELVALRKGGAEVAERPRRHVADEHDVVFRECEPIDLDLCPIVDNERRTGPAATADARELHTALSVNKDRVATTALDRDREQIRFATAKQKPFAKALKGSGRRLRDELRAGSGRSIRSG